MGVGVATVENSMDIPQKIRNESALWPSKVTSGYISTETQNTNSKEYTHPYVHSYIIYNSQDIEPTQCPSVDEWTQNCAAYTQWDTIQP